ncbi:hypothetical protein ACFPYN_11075 [Paenisporosarcina macmurdoensis]|uniref:Uncharacterized protein n=1 Tax=Paenisporosarcina macmurdoensis TaxID=212659 RepID=A0ABW1LA45_9BACL
MITTKPLLSFLLTLDKEEEKNYHLWITTNGEGYIQRLLPDKSSTFKLDASSVKELSKLINEQEKVPLIGKIRIASVLRILTILSSREFLNIYKARMESCQLVAFLLYNYEIIQ